MAITKVTSGLISADASSIDLNIDAGTLYLDVSENRVGIGTTSPSSEFHVKGDATTLARIEPNDSSGKATLLLSSTSVGDGGIQYDSNSNLMHLFSYNYMTFNVGTGNISGGYPSNERMRIDSSGNVGIGTSSPEKRLHITDSTQANQTIRFGNPSATPYGEINYDSSGFEHLYITSKGTTTGYGNIVFNTGGTPSEAMRIDASGTVKMSVNGSVASLILENDADKPYMSFTESGSAKFYIGESAGVGGGDGFYDLYATSGLGQRFFTGAAERMRIDSSGNVGIGTSSPDANLTVSASSVSGGVVKIKDTDSTVGLGNTILGLYFSNDDDCSTATFIGMYDSGSRIGSITVTNATSVAFNTTSDYRLKENVTYEFNALDRIAQLKPARFNWISDETNTLVDGFLAHEVSDIVPEAIHGEKDAVMEEEYEITPAVLDDDGNVVTEAEMGTRVVPDYQGIDQSKLVPLLTKAIQEQQTIIDDLKTRIETLENA